VQDKTSAAMINLPVARAGERHILKLNPLGEFPHLVENEAFFLDAAQQSGLTLPPRQLVFDQAGVPGLLIQRFDRVTVSGRLHALAVEDGCQAADRPPADKYLLGTEATFAGLCAVCDAPALAGRELVRQLAFAYLIGNGDAHAKNFAVLENLAGERVVSPLYDVPSSYLDGDTTMALSIGGRSGGDFGGRDFLALGQGLVVPGRAIRRALTDLDARVDRWLPDLDRLPFASRTVATLRRSITYRRQRLAQC
jgi:serine/threonine-protein kinase HipA